MVCCLFQMMNEPEVGGMRHSTHNRSFRGQVFAANHLAMVLTKQTYNNQIQKNPKIYTQETPKTIPNKTKLNLV